MNDLLCRAQDCLLISGVTLREGKFTLREDVDLESFDRSDSAAQGFRSFEKIKAAVLTDADGKELWEYRYGYAAGVRLVPEDEREASQEEEYAPPIEVLAEFEARYLSFEEVEEDALLEFSKNNVGYHVWPYWREFVQSSCSRLGVFPPIDIPTYRIVKEQAESTESE